MKLGSIQNTKLKQTATKGLSPAKTEKKNLLSNLIGKTSKSC